MFTMFINRRVLIAKLHISAELRLPLEKRPARQDGVRRRQTAAPLLPTSKTRRVFACRAGSAAGASPEGVGVGGRGAPWRTLERGSTPSNTLLSPMYILGTPSQTLLSPMYTLGSQQRGGFREAFGDPPRCPLPQNGASRRFESRPLLSLHQIIPCLKNESL